MVWAWKCRVWKKTCAGLTPSVFFPRNYDIILSSMWYQLCSLAACFLVFLHHFLNQIRWEKIRPLCPRGGLYHSMHDAYLNEWMNESLFAIDNNTRKKSMSRNNSPGRTVGLRLNTALNTALIKTNKIRYARQMQYRYTTTCSNVEINSIKLCEWQFKRFIFVKYDIYGCDKLELLG